jgi:hypothetical protein
VWVWIGVWPPGRLSYAKRIASQPGAQRIRARVVGGGCVRGEAQRNCGNDPSAGSPTETLLRLQLPLEDKV